MKANSNRYFSWKLNQPLRTRRFLLLMLAIGTSMPSMHAQTLRQLPSASSEFSNPMAPAVVRDPTTGKAYQLQVQNLPKLKHEWKRSTRIRKTFQPAMVVEYETRKAITYVPRYEANWQHQARGQWNPFQRDYFAYKYVPEVQWIPVVQYYHIPVLKKQWYASAQVEPMYERVDQTENTQRIVATEINSSATARTASQPSPRLGMAYLSEKSIGNASSRVWRSDFNQAVGAAANRPPDIGPFGRDVSSLAANPTSRRGQRGQPSAQPARDPDSHWETTQSAMAPTVLR